MDLTADPISMRDHMIATAAGSASFFESLKLLGISAFELQVDPDLTTPHLHRADGLLHCLASDDGINTFLADLEANSARIPAILLMTDFSSDSMAEQIDWTVRAARVAARLGASAVRVDPLARNKELPREKVRDNFIAGIQRVLHDTAGSNIAFGIENHGPFGNDPAFLDEIFAAVEDRRLGLTLDTGNFYWWGVPLEELYALLEKYAPRAVHTHIKNINYPPDLANVRRSIGLDYGKHCCALDEGNIDLRRVMGILSRSGYRGNLCIENEMLGNLPPDRRIEVLRRDVNAVQRAITT